MVIDLRGEGLSVDGFVLSRISGFSGMNQGQYLEGIVAEIDPSTRLWMNREG